MATFFMKLGFTERVLADEGFHNILLNGEKVGVNLDININYYRGLALSCIQKLKVKIDGKEIPQNLMVFALNEKKFPVDRLPELFEEYWGIKETAHLMIFNGGLEDGEHEVDLTLHLRNPYMQFGPGMYGAIDSSSKKTMMLKEAEELC